MSEIKHINYAIPAKRHTAMYLMHKFWARKPANVVKEYIEAYSDEGDIVFDPFCGSGVAPIEAALANRKGIAVDLDPLACFITKMTLKPVDLDNVRKTWNIFIEKVKPKILKFYEIECPRCKQIANVRSVKWSYTVECPHCEKEVIMAKAKRPPGVRQNIYNCPNCSEKFSYANQEIKNEVALEIKCTCKNCNYKGIINNQVQDDVFDLSQYWYPNIDFYYPNGKSFKTKRRAKIIEELFTKRNIVALSILREEIDQIEDQSIQDLFLFIFSSTIPQTSKLMISTPTSGPSWKVPEYMIFALHYEFDVWSRFENRYKAILKGKEQSNERIKEYNEAHKFADLINGDNFYVLNKNAIELTKGKTKLPPNSVDYVFTDPPYGGSIQYYELNLIRTAWLRGKNKDERFLHDWWKDEITINTGQEKNFEYYHRMLSSAFEEIYTVLKPGARACVTCTRRLRRTL